MGPAWGPDPEGVEELIRKYNRPVPRYTSYPTALEFHDGVGEAAYREALAQANQRPADAWSLYVHVPFCEQRCHFCACSVVATRSRDKVAAPYTQKLIEEIGRVAAATPDRRRVAQLHLGGGTPTYLPPRDLEALFGAVREHYDLAPGAEIAVELDPRVTTDAHLDVLIDAGVNRVSLGVQDLDRDVQAAIGRDQPARRTWDHIERFRASGVRGINVDLIYGLPRQNAEGFARTVDRVIRMEVDRVALYSYAHMPWAHANQRKIHAQELPSPDEKLALFLAGRKAFLRSGYRAIGMDHFSRIGDELEVADRTGRLHRNFMGYTVAAGPDTLGFGASAIGEVGGVFFQNHKKLVHYGAALDGGHLATARGLVRTQEDTIRARVIADFMCRHQVDREQIERAFALDSFDRHFGPDLEALAGVIADGLVQDDGRTLRVTDRGRPFVRNVAACFDERTRTRRAGGPQRLHSRAV